MKKIFVILLLLVTAVFITTSPVFALGPVVDDTVNVTTLRNTLYQKKTTDGKKWNEGIIENYYRVVSTSTSSNTNTENDFFLGFASDSVNVNGYSTRYFTIKKAFESQTTVAFEENLKRGLVYTTLLGANLVDNTYTNSTSGLSLLTMLNNYQPDINGQLLYVTGLNNVSISTQFNVNPSKTNARIGMFATVVSTNANMSQRDIYWWGHKEVRSFGAQRIHFLVNIHYEVVYLP